MDNRIEKHYVTSSNLANTIAERLAAAGKDMAKLCTEDLAPVDEFHIRGRKATLELAEQMNLGKDTRVLDIGSGLGGPARTLAQSFGCHVTGVDLTEAFCEAATILSDWVGLGERVAFQQGDATDLPFGEQEFDAAMTIHVAMNIEAKDQLYKHVRRVMKPGGIFTIYDVLQGEGGEVQYPVPWAREPSISFLATPQDMEQLLSDAGFNVLATYDSTEESQSWFEAMAKRLSESGPPPLTMQVFLGDDFPAMAKNQIQNLRERRIRTVSYICRA
ncbi:class I SAM-dependent methyltransferase [Sedimenticola sp.]|uniref:class I SAM-dependent methyltransferase n=1 Tax=Sedimenticola sp. TaxID=1940285 RepID=UPI003D0AC768